MTRIPHVGRLVGGATLSAALVLTGSVAAFAQDEHEHDHGSPSDPTVGGGDYTSAVTMVSWFVPEGYTAVTHGIPGADTHADSYAHHAMFNYPEGTTGALPVGEGHVLAEVGVNEADQLCLDGPATAASPDELIAALLDYNVRLFPDNAASYQAMSPISPTTWSNGVEAGGVGMTMEGMTGAWTAWALDDDAVAWVFVGGPEGEDFGPLSDKIATSIRFGGDAAFLDELYADFQLEDPCSLIPEE